MAPCPIWQLLKFCFNLHTFIKRLSHLIWPHGWCTKWDGKHRTKQITSSASCAHEGKLETVYLYSCCNFHLLQNKVQHSHLCFRDFLLFSTALIYKYWHLLKKNFKKNLWFCFVFFVSLLSFSPHHSATNSNSITAVGNFPTLCRIAKQKSVSLG